MARRTRNKHQRLDATQITAVVGLGLSLPGAVSIDEFWFNILENHRFFTPASALDWGADPELFYQPGGPTSDKAYSLNGAFNYRRAIDPEGLKLPDNFDLKGADGSLAFWLTAGRDAAAEVTWSGLDPARVGVISGHTILPSTAMAEAAVSLYTREATRNWPTKPHLDPPPQGAFRLLGYSARLLAQALGFSGEAFTLDAACASSLYAVHLATQKLLAGELDAVITGGVAKADALFTQIGFSQLRVLAASGTISPFDARADGLIVGEGAVALVLKRLDRALADGDSIRALIRGVGLSNDMSGTILAPQAEGQLRAMKAAWLNAGLSPRAVGLIEAHGTGTILGDKVEVETIKHLLADPDFPVPVRPQAPPVLGSVKSNIGHLLSAAGAASLAKSILALEHHLLPPTAGFEKEAPALNLTIEPALRILTKPEPWIAPSDGNSRLAMVNAFGFGGVNGQVIVEEFQPEKWAIPTKPKEKCHKTVPTTVSPPYPPVRLLSALALSAPWPDFASLAQNWMNAEGPPIISTRRFGTLKATGLFFNSLILEGVNLRLTPKDLANILPQQALALKMAAEALNYAHLDIGNNRNVVTGQWADPTSPGLDKTRVGVYMGVDIDPRSADYAFRWLGPLRAAEALVAAGELRERDVPEFVATLRHRSHPPLLTASRVVGALGSLVASRVARFVGSGGPAFTITNENVSGLTALKLAIAAIGRREIDLALVGVVLTLGDPKTAALDQSHLWEEGAAMLVVAGSEAADILGRRQAPELLALPSAGDRLSSLGGLFQLVKNAFFIRHRLTSRGLGAGAAYWIKNRNDPPRRLESSGFTITETSSEEVSSPPFSYEDATWFLVRAKDRKDGQALLDRLEQMVRSNKTRHNLVEVLGPIRAEKRALKGLGDHFWAEYGGISGARPTLAILAKGFDDLLVLIKKARANLSCGKQSLTPDQRNRIIWALEGERVQGKLAWVFPGSGNHYHGLGRRLAMAFPHLMGKLEDKVTRLADHFQSAVFWGPSPKEASPLQAILAQISFGLLGAQVLTYFKIRPQAVLGYSLGETTSLVATGAWADREALYNDLVKSPLFTNELAGRYQAARRSFSWPKDRYFKWVMGVLPSPAEKIKAALATLPEPYFGRAFLLLINTPDEGVVGGEENAVRALVQALGSTLYPLEGVAAVHNPTIASLADEYRLFHTRATTPPETIRFYSAAWARAYEPTAENTAASLTEQALHGHNFPRLIEQAYADGIRFFVEVGPGASTSRMINKILQGRSHLASSLTPSPAEEGWLGIHRLLVELWMAGYPLKMSVLYPDAEGTHLILPIPITLAPTTVLWPTPEELLTVIRANTDQSPNSKKSEPEAPFLKKNPPDSNQAQDIFNHWLTETKELHRQEEEILKTSTPAPLDRQKCLAFAVGRISEALGSRFEEVDLLPSRVRLPNEPLMFVDRVLTLEGQPLSLSSGRIVTEHEVKPGAWYLDQQHMPVGLTIEAGQADLMLSAWLGVDLATKGLALYRLLDAEVTFHRKLPEPGDTIRYDIRITRFFKYGQTNLFRFEFDGFLNSQPLMTMRGGCAGFFTPAELAGGRGLPGGGLTDNPPSSYVNPAAVGLIRSKIPQHLDSKALTALRAGDFIKAFGPGFTPDTALNNLPSGSLALIDRVTALSPGGGRYRAGFIRSEIDIDPQAWFLTSHFKDDEVMPGTLMYESCLQTLRVFLMASGWVGDPLSTSWQPIQGIAATLKCRGQVTQTTITTAYEIHVRRLEFTPPPEGGEAEPTALAEAIVLADNRPIVEVRNLNLRLKGSSKACLKRLWSHRVNPVREKNDPHFFNKAKIMALAEGRPSEALGPGFARFDDGSFVARLPRAPYDFLDQITIINGQRYKVQEGSEVSGRYVIDADSHFFAEAGPASPLPPFAVLNEIALQPCGFLASYMGSVLSYDGPMHFRNLGGRATVLAETRGGDAVDTNVRLTRFNRLGEIVIQHYEFTCTVGHRTIYKGVTHFGFFSPETLANQIGLTGVDFSLWPDRPSDEVLLPYPNGPAYPTGRWRIIDRIYLEPYGGPEGLGQAFAVTKVDPKIWFFEAHFFQDPVCPGSLGLESLIQATKALFLARFPNQANSDPSFRWNAPAQGQTHEWLYRGQVTRDKKEMTINLLVRAVDETDPSLTVDGLLAVDGLTIYEMKNFTVAARYRPRTRLALSATVLTASPAVVQAKTLLDWRKNWGLSQSQLAKLLGVTPIYVSLMERGKRNISPLMAEKLDLIFKTTSISPVSPSDQKSLAILAKGTLKSRREDKMAAANLLTAEKLRELRQAKKLSQKKLANLVGVTATLIGLIELGKRGLNLNLAKKILAILKD